MTEQLIKKFNHNMKTIEKAIKDLQNDLDLIRAHLTEAKENYITNADSIIKAEKRIEKLEEEAQEIINRNFQYQIDEQKKRMDTFMNQWRDAISPFISRIEKLEKEIAELKKWIGKLEDNYQGCVKSVIHNHEEIAELKSAIADVNADHIKRLNVLRDHLKRVDKNCINFYEVLRELIDGLTYESFMHHTYSKGDLLQQLEGEISVAVEGSRKDDKTASLHKSLNNSIPADSTPSYKTIEELEKIAEEITVKKSTDEQKLISEFIEDIKKYDKYPPELEEKWKKRLKE